MHFYKPFFNKTLYLNELLVRNYKVLKFKHKKWFQATLIFKQQLIENKLNKFKCIDQKKLLLNFRSTKGNNYKYNYKFYFSCLKRLKCCYLVIFKGIFNKIIALHMLLNFLERRIDVNLLKSKFCSTLREAKKLIINGCILINKYKVTIKSYILSCGDIVKLKITLRNYTKLLINCFKWTVPIINKIINYTTKEMLIFNLLTNLTLNFPYYLYLHKIYITQQ
jgi:ribosomal protein S4